MAKVIYNKYNNSKSSADMRQGEYALKDGFILIKGFNGSLTRLSDGLTWSHIDVSVDRILPEGETFTVTT